MEQLLQDSKFQFEMAVGSVVGSVVAVVAVAHNTAVVR